MRAAAPVQLGERRYEIDPEKLRWSTVRPTREGVDQGAAPGETSLSNETVWRRSRESWHLGAGQEYVDLIDESDPLRFHSSKGVDVWDRRALRLLHSAASKRPSEATIQFVKAVSTTHLYHVAGTDIRWTADPTVADPSWTNTSYPGSAVTGVTTDGSRIYVADGANVRRADAGGAWSVFSTYDADVIGYANGRLIAADGGEVVELDAAGDPIPIFTHPNPDFLWEGIVTSPGGIYIFGHAGDRSEVYSIFTIDATGGLDVPFWAAALPDGELLNEMVFYGGIMVMGTTRGVRLALITGGGFLSFGPVIEIENGVWGLEGQGEDVWFGWSNFDEESTGLGRVRLARFTSDLVPAYASDLMATPRQGRVQSVESFGGRRYFTVNEGGLWGEIDAYEQEGHLEAGQVTWGIPEEKTLDSGTLWGDEIAEGEAIRLDVANEVGDDLLAVVLEGVGKRKATEGHEGTTPAERLLATITLTGPGTTTPTLRRWTLRASPRPFISSEIILPLNLKDVVANETGGQWAVDVLDEVAYLDHLRDTRERVPLVIGKFKATVRVEEHGTGGEDSIDGWQGGQRQDFIRGVWYVRVVTAEEGIVE